MYSKKAVSIYPGKPTEIGQCVCKAARVVWLDATTRLILIKKSIIVNCRKDFFA
jgi:hypothetical protein